MLVLLDVGNTSITFGLYQKGRISRPESYLHNEIPQIKAKIKLSGGNSHTNIIISSNVPVLIPILRKALSSYLLWVVGEDLPVPLKHKYKNIQKLGIDRQVNLYGANLLYKKPLIVMDFGTAITVDYLSAKGVFEGGMIIPGPELAFQALIDKAARIPKKSSLPTKAKKFIGQDTQECMNSGILQGYGAMTDELIRRFKSNYGNHLGVIISGGFSEHLKPYITSQVIYDPKIALEALYLLYRAHQNSLK